MGWWDAIEVGWGDMWGILGGYGGGYGGGCGGVTWTGQGLRVTRLDR